MWMAAEKVTDVMAFAEGGELTPLTLDCRICKTTWECPQKSPALSQIIASAQEHYRNAGHDRGL